MAIAFARMEFVQRSSGQNACFKSSYISREKIKFEGTKFHPEKTFDFRWKGSTVHSEISAPDNCPAVLKNRETLWNIVESMEKRKDSSVGMEVVVALPDDLVVSVENRKELVRRFATDNFSSKGYVVDWSIHPPDEFSERDADGNEVAVRDHNWHAHLLITPRLINEEGTGFSNTKPKDLLPQVRLGTVISGDQWGKLWGKFQNDFFQEKGIDLRVDDTGLVAQKHLGPYRLRGKGTALLDRSDLIKLENAELSTDPEKVLDKLTETKSTFTRDELKHFISKNIFAEGTAQGFEKSFWSQPSIVELLDKKTHEPSGSFTSKLVMKEEKQSLRFAEELRAKKGCNLKGLSDQYTTSLNQEQLAAFKAIGKGKNLELIEGHAGTGKSFLFTALASAYEEKGQSVRAFGQDNATAAALKEKGFDKATNVLRFLYSLKNNKTRIKKGKEVWLVDESAKLGNRSFNELLRQANRHGAQVVAAGCSSQIAAVDRGGLFTELTSKYGAHVLEDIQRQKKEEHRLVAKDLAHGKVGDAINRMVQQKRIHWYGSKLESLEAMVAKWSNDTEGNAGFSSMMIVRSNQDVRLVNQLVRQVRYDRGELGKDEFKCDTKQGMCFVSTGDKIEFRVKNNTMGIHNGTRGTLVSCSEDQFRVKLSDAKEVVTFNPSKFSGYQLGYATTTYRSQGATINQVYVSHGRGMTRNEFYVAGTRHTESADLFVSREEGKNLSYLKWSLDREEIKATSTAFTTRSDLTAAAEKAETASRGQELLESSKWMDRLKGVYVKGKEVLKEEVSSAAQRIDDRYGGNAFYNYKGDKDTEVRKSERQTTLSVNLDAPDLSTVMNGEGATALKQEEIQKTDSLSQETPSLSSNQWGEMSDTQVERLEDYLNKEDRAFFLKELAQDEANSLGTDIRSTPHFKPWQRSCAERNESAGKVSESFTSDHLTELYGEGFATSIQSLSERHKELIENTQPLSKESGSKPSSQDFKDDITALIESSFAWKGDLSEKAKGAFSELSESQDGARAWRAICQDEASHLDKDTKNTLHFSDWMAWCGERNRSALNLVDSLDPKEMSLLLAGGAQNDLKELSGKARDPYDDLKLELPVEKEEFAEALNELSTSGTNMVKRYIDSCSISYEYQKAMKQQAEILGVSESTVPAFFGRLASASVRNQAAHDLLQVLKSESLKEVLSARTSAKLLTQSEKYQHSLDRRGVKDCNLPRDVTTLSDAVDRLAESANRLESLSTEQREVFRNYLLSNSKAQALVSIVALQESKLGVMRNRTPHASDMFSACIERNQGAQALLSSIDEPTLKKILAEGGLERIQSQAEKSKIKLEGVELPEAPNRSTESRVQELSTLKETEATWKSLDVSKYPNLWGGLLLSERSSLIWKGMVDQSKSCDLAWRTTPFYDSWREVTTTRNHAALMAVRDDLRIGPLVTQHVTNERALETFKEVELSTTLPSIDRSRFSKIESKNDSVAASAKAALEIGIVSTNREMAKNKVSRSLLEGSSSNGTNWREILTETALSKFVGLASEERSRLSRIAKGRSEGTDGTMIRGWNAKKAKSAIKGAPRVHSATRRCIEMRSSYWSLESVPQPWFERVATYLKHNETASKLYSITSFEKDVRKAAAALGPAEPASDDSKRRQSESYQAWTATTRSALRLSPPPIEESDRSRFLSYREAFPPMFCKKLERHCRNKDEMGLKEPKALDRESHDGQIKQLIKERTSWMRAAQAGKGVSPKTERPPVQFAEEIKSRWEMRLKQSGVASSGSKTPEKTPRYEQESPPPNSEASISKLNDEQRKKLNSYIAYRDKARKNWERKEMNASKIEGASGFGDLGLQKHKELCGSRNEAAHALKSSVSKKELKDILGDRQMDKLVDLAQRHENLQAKRNEKGELRMALQENIERLVVHLYPDAPIRRLGKTLRVGNKGALSVELDGSKKGAFFNHETDDKGGPIQLIMSREGLSYEQATDWARNFIGMAPTIEVPKQFKAPQWQSGAKGEWNSLVPCSSNPAPSLESVSGGFFAKEDREDARYAYRDSDGKLLFYTLRLVSKETGKKSGVLPLSYGHVERRESHPVWKVKRFNIKDNPLGLDKNPLYGQHLLKQNPDAKVIIVEGEKTTDAAQKLLGKEYVAISWMGGSQAVPRNNQWDALAGREVIIWPDNDKAGYEASEAVVKELSKVGVRSVSVVNERTLAKKFPEKWDLADKLPEGVSKEDVSLFIQVAVQQDISSGKAPDLARTKEPALSRSSQGQIEV